MKQKVMFSQASLMVLLAIVVFWLVPSCSTILPVPEGKMFVKNMVVDQVLGPILLGPMSTKFKTYDQIIEEARKLYPNAEGVVYYSSEKVYRTMFGKVLVAMPVGYYAVTFKMEEPLPPPTPTLPKASGSFNFKVE